MKILEITCSGYKNLGRTTINFSGNRIIAVIAPNNYGKSNLLEAFAFAVDFIQASPVQKKRMMEYIPSIPIRTLLDKENFFFEVTAESGYSGKPVIMKYNFSFAWKKTKEGTGSRVISEELLIKENGSGAKYRTCILRDNDNIKYLRSETGRCDSPLRVAADELALVKVANIESVFYSWILDEIIKLKFSVQQLMDINQSFRLINLPLRNAHTHDFDSGRNIRKFLYFLKQRDKRKYNLLINSMKELIPEIESIEIIEADLRSGYSVQTPPDVPFLLPDKFYDIRVKEINNNQETGIEFLSRGSLRILMILASAIDAMEQGVDLLAIEELETAIHPQLLQRLLIVLTGLEPDLKILTTSHSPDLLQYLPLSCIYLGIPNSGGIAAFGKLKNQKQKSVMKYVTDAELNLGEYLFDLMLDLENDPERKEDMFEPVS